VKVKEIMAANVTSCGPNVTLVAAAWGHTGIQLRYASGDRLRRKGDRHDHGSRHLPRRE
jgi:hypothetical protein